MKKLVSEDTVKGIKKYRWFYLMFLPVFLGLIVFHYIPMIGIGVSLFDYTPYGKPEFVGLENFLSLFSSRLFWRAFRNTLIISCTNIVLSMVFSVGVALLLDEINCAWFKKLSQTINYIPHFMSWVVVASIFSIILSPQDGYVNAIIKFFGGKPIYFLASESWWRPIFYFIERWKETGWGTIIFVAAISGVNQEQYEAAIVDGVNHVQRVWYITLPAISNTILIVFILNLAKVLNLFDPVWVLQNSMVQNVSDVLGTYVYRLGIDRADYGLSTAAGVFKSVISVVLVTLANKASKSIRGEGIL